MGTVDLLFVLFPRPANRPPSADHHAVTIYYERDEETIP